MNLKTLYERTAFTHPWKVETLKNHPYSNEVADRLGKLTDFKRLPRIGNRGELIIVWAFTHEQDRDMFVAKFCTRTRVGERYFTGEESS